MLMNREIYDQYRKIRKELAHVFVDDVEVTDFCMEADTDAGTAFCLVPKKNKKPFYFFYRNKDGTLVTELKRGKVEITFAPLDDNRIENDTNESSEEKTNT